MRAVRSYVTIGSQHKGPHVDALYALAERCGAEVVVVGSTGGAWGGNLRPLPARKPLPYAGFDADDLLLWSNRAGATP